MLGSDHSLTGGRPTTTMQSTCFPATSIVSGGCSFPAASCLSISFSQPTHPVSGGLGIAPVELSTGSSQYCLRQGYHRHSLVPSDWWISQLPSSLSSRR